MPHHMLNYAFTPALALALTAGAARAQADAQPSREAPPAVEGQPAVPAGATQAATPSEARYTLTEVSGKGLPVEVEKEWRCREAVTAGTLTLRQDGRWLLETTKQETCGDQVKEDRDTDDGTYRREGGTVRFFDDDGDENTADRDRDEEIDLDDFRTGTVAGDGTLTVELADGKNRLLFRGPER